MITIHIYEAVIWGLGSVALAAFGFGVHCWLMQNKHEAEK
jgi:hypothetical protein